MESRNGFLLLVFALLGSCGQQNQTTTGNPAAHTSAAALALSGDISGGQAEGLGQNVRSEILAGNCAAYAQAMNAPAPDSNSAQNGYVARVTQPTAGQVLNTPTMNLQGTCVGNLQIFLSTDNEAFNIALAATNNIVTTCQNGQFQTQVAIPAALVTSVTPTLVTLRVLPMINGAASPVGKNPLSIPVIMTQATDMAIKNIASPADFIAATDSHTYYNLTEDLDFSAAAPIAIGTNFAGVLNGNGHTIKNLKIANASTGAGIFYGFDGFMTNIHFENVTLESNTPNGYMGIIAGQCTGAIFDQITFDNITLSNTAPSNYVGVLCGAAYNTTIRNTSITNAQIAGNTYTGGFVGQGVELVAAQLTFSGTVKGGNYVAGLAGSSEESCITDSTSTGAFYGSTQVGSLVGSASGTTPLQFKVGTNLIGAFFKMSATAPQSAYTSSILNSAGSGNVVGNLDFGGAVGDLGYTFVSNSSFQGSVRGYNPNSDPDLSYTGVTILDFGCRGGGFASYAGGSTILNSTSNANIFGRQSMAGFTQTMKNSFVRNSSAQGSVAMLPYAGRMSSSSACFDGFSGFTNVVGPFGVDGTTGLPNYLDDPTPGGSVIAASSTKIPQGTSIPNAIWAAHLNTFTPAPSGGDNLQWLAGK